MPSMSWRLLTLCALLAIASADLRAQQPSGVEAAARELLRPGSTWIYAYTSRLPLDPLDSWNKQEAKVTVEGGSTTLHVLSPYTGHTSTYVLAWNADGFAFENPGVGTVLMRLDAADPKAPFKGQVGSRTYWLLRAQ